MLYGKDKIKVVDFGLARYLEGELSTCTSSRTTAGNKSVASFNLSKTVGFGVGKSVLLTVNCAGTPQFEAPELFTNIPQKLDVCKQADLYSFGVVLWHMCTLEQPWTGMSPIQIGFALINSDPVQRLGVPHHVSEDLTTLIEDLFWLEPNARPSFNLCVTTLNDLIANRPANQLRSYHSTHKTQTLKGKKPVVQTHTAQTTTGRSTKTTPVVQTHTHQTTTGRSTKTTPVVQTHTQPATERTTSPTLQQPNQQVTTQTTTGRSTKTTTVRKLQSKLPSNPMPTD